MEQLAIPDTCYVPLSQLRRTIDKELRRRSKAEHECIAWLIGAHGCSYEVLPYVERLFREFNRVEAWNRAHVLDKLTGAHCVDGWSIDDAEYIGLYDHTITDYHVLWDRGWAIAMLVPRELVPKVCGCDYGSRPKFWDRNGNLLFQSVYCVDGHILTKEERRQALAEAGDAE